MEMHKRKAIESAQSAADLKLHLEKYHSQIKVKYICLKKKFTLCFPKTSPSFINQLFSPEDKYVYYGFFAELEK